MRIKFVLIFAITTVFSCNSKSEESTKNQTVDEYVAKNQTYTPVTQQDNFENTSTENDETEMKDCFDVHSSADDAYTYCRRAYNSDDYDEIKSYLKKAMRSFENTMSFAGDCKCDDAYSSADEGYTYAKRGYNSDDFDEMKDYARKVKNSADNTMSNSNDCTNN